jgi:hypothetical protein
MPSGTAQRDNYQLFEFVLIVSSLTALIYRELLRFTISALVQVIALCRSN